MSFFLFICVHVLQRRETGRAQYVAGTWPYEEREAFFCLLLYVVAPPEKPPPPELLVRQNSPQPHTPAEGPTQSPTHNMATRSRQCTPAGQ